MDLYLFLSGRIINAYMRIRKFCGNRNVQKVQQQQQIDFLYKYSGQSRTIHISAKIYIYKYLWMSNVDIVLNSSKLDKNRMRLGSRWYHFQGVFVYASSFSIRKKIYILLSKWNETEKKKNVWPEIIDIVRCCVYCNAKCMSIDYLD